MNALRDTNERLANRVEEIQDAVKAADKALNAAKRCAEKEVSRHPSSWGI